MVFSVKSSRRSLVDILFWNWRWYHGVKYSSDTYVVRHCSRPTSCFTSCHVFTRTQSWLSWKEGILQLVSSACVTGRKVHFILKLPFIVHQGYRASTWETLAEFTISVTEVDFPSVASLCVQVNNAGMSSVFHLHTCYAVMCNTVSEYTPGGIAFLLKLNHTERVYLWIITRCTALSLPDTGHLGGFERRQLPVNCFIMCKETTGGLCETALHGALQELW